MPSTNAERCKKYRECNRAEKKKRTAERVRAHRLRQKMLADKLIQKTDGETSSSGPGRVVFNPEICVVTSGPRQQTSTQNSNTFAAQSRLNWQISPRCYKGRVTKKNPLTSTERSRIWRAKRRTHSTESPLIQALSNPEIVIDEENASSPQESTAEHDQFQSNETNSHFELSQLTPEFTIDAEVITVDSDVEEIVTPELTANPVAIPVDTEPDKIIIPDFTGNPVSTLVESDPKELIIPEFTAVTSPANSDPKQIIPRDITANSVNITVDAEVTDLRNKMYIVYKVLQECEKRKYGNNFNTSNTIVENLFLFTDLPKGLLSKVVEKAKIPEACDELKYTVIKTPQIDIAIRQAMIAHYLKNNEILRLDSLQAIFPKQSLYEIRQNLKGSGYIWKRLPKTRKAIIIERPERVLERQRFLEQINNYRKNKRTIVYVEEKIIHKSHTDFGYFRQFLPDTQNSYGAFVAVVTKDGYIDRNILIGSTVLKCQELIEKNFMKNILPRLPKSSVIILEDKPHINKSMPIPTMESKKSYMINWLNCYDIPHDESSHRCELFQLIENCKIKEDIYEFDSLVQAHGHDVLRRPIKTYYLSYFKPLWDSITKPEKKYINEIITNQPPDYWLSLEETLVANEQIVYSEDLELENIIDKIFTAAKYDNDIINELVNAECDEQVDTLKMEEYVINCHN